MSILLIILAILGLFVIIGAIANSDKSEEPKDKATRTTEYNELQEWHKTAAAANKQATKEWKEWVKNEGTPTIALYRKFLKKSKEEFDHIAWKRRDYSKLLIQTGLYIAKASPSYINALYSIVKTLISQIPVKEDCDGLISDIAKNCGLNKDNIVSIREVYWADDEGDAQLCYFVDMGEDFNQLHCGNESLEPCAYNKIINPDSGMKYSLDLPLNPYFNPGFVNYIAQKITHFDSHFEALKEQKREGYISDILFPTYCMVGSPELILNKGEEDFTFKCPLIKEQLKQVAQTLLDFKTIEENDMIWSSMTIANQVFPNDIFAEVLNTYFDGQEFDYDEHLKSLGMD